MMIKKTIAALAVAALLTTPALADWTQWGHDKYRNMTSPAKNIPASFDPGKMKDNERIDESTTKNVKWVTKLGSQTYGNCTVSNGKIFIGTNNGAPRDKTFKGDYGVVMAFTEKEGKFLWQLVVPKLGAGKVSDWEYLGICSSPAVDGNRVYVVTNRGEVVCMDTEGMANGNQGMQDEGKYAAGGTGTVKVGKDYADIIWVYDIRKQLDVFPHNITSTSVLIVGDTLYCATSNGKDWSHKNLPSPLAPTLIALDKKTGKLIGEEAVGISKRTLHCNWSSPTWAKVDGKDQLIWGAGDGWVYGFDPEPKEDADGFMVFPPIWRVNLNPPEYVTRDGKPIPYAHRLGVSEVIGTPIFYEGKIYVGTGQDPEHGNGVGHFVCIDPTKKGDVTDKGGIVWGRKDIGRTISTASAGDGLVYIAEYAGKVHCLDARTGERYWEHDTRSHIWASTLLVDGKVFIGDEDGVVTVFEHGKKLKVLNKIKMSSPVYHSPIAANNTLYIANQTHLYAITDMEKGGKATASAKGAGE